MNYEESFFQSLSFGLSLRDAGASKGDVLALLLPNSIEYALAFTGAPVVGMTLTTMNPIYTPVEIGKQLKLSKAKWAVTNRELYPKVKEALEKLGVAKEWEGRIIIAGGGKATQIACHQRSFFPSIHFTDPLPGLPAFNDMLTHPNAGSKLSDLNLPSMEVHEDVVVLPFSSGTTGVPKGVMLTHFNIVANVCQSVRSEKEIATIKETKG